MADLMSMRADVSSRPSWDDPLWYKDAIIYEVHVRAFADSNGDGIGDFRGLASKLDYIQDLGVTALWLLPFYPSPLRDDGYDIADYENVHPSYGTLDDFRRFLDMAHDRSIRVITELVINHTSDQHPWFQRSRRAAPGTTERDFYVWSDTPERYPDVRIIFQDTETSNWAWDPLAKAYYWHRFFSHQPDLNYDNPAVREAVHAALDFWLDMGVDGLRLDAIPYLYERDGTNGENLPETHEELKILRRHVDERYPNRMFLAEANQWPEDTVAYFGEGDECHMAFHFPLMPRLFMAIQTENRFPVIDILEQTPAIPETAQWAIFLRNHDELTLEMVTEEERDFMYKVYAEDRRARLNLGIRRRLAPLLGGDRRKIELMNALLYSLLGTPVLYYGDEIGMGDNIFLGDRDGVRTPMQWSATRNAGFSDANPQQLYLPVIIDPSYHYESVNVESQHANTSSLWWWTKRMLALRKRHPVFGRGAIEFLHPSNARVLAFLRYDGNQTVLVVANLSRHSQFVELDLSRFSGAVAVELFGRTEFPPVGDQPYLLSLGPYAFYWFAVEPAAEAAHEPSVPEMRMDGELASLLGHNTELGWILRDHVYRRSWYFERFQPVLSTDLWAVATFGAGDDQWLLCRFEMEYPEGEPGRYVVPLTVLWGAGPDVPEVPEQAVVARVWRGEQAGLLVDATWHPRTQADLAGLANRQIPEGADHLEVVAINGGIPPDEVCESVDDSSEGHTRLIYGSSYVLKLVRRLEPGINPDLEMRTFLTAETDFDGLAPVLRAVEMRRPGESMVLAILERFIPNEGTAWSQTTDSLRRFYEAVGALPAAVRDEVQVPSPALTELIDREPPQLVRDLIAGDLAAAEALGRHTAALHLALASSFEDPAFRPEPMTTLYQRSLYQSLRSSVRQNLGIAERRDLAPGIRDAVDALRAAEADILRCLHRVVAGRMTGVRIRCHGDYRLDEVLFTGTDYVQFDFTGDSTRPLSERRIKASPVRDLAEMLRSYDYATRAAMQDEVDAGAIPDEAVAVFDRWGRTWYRWVGAALLRAYREAGGSRLLPGSLDDIQALLDAYALEKASRELLWEIDHRPDWAFIPLAAMHAAVEVERART